jgi:2,4-dihydroxy-1,4-benzoxazin-3-one-glucoside dioxygenase
MCGPINSTFFGFKLVAFMDRQTQETLELSTRTTLDSSSWPSFNHRLQACSRVVASGYPLKQTCAVRRRAERKKHGLALARGTCCRLFICIAVHQFTRPPPTMASTAAASAGYDRLAEVKAFDDTKAGVKGLVDAGVTAVPRIFHHPPDPHHAPPPPSRGDHLGSIPVIDLLAARAELVKQVKAAAETAGFFQVVNHGVPEAAMSEMLSGVRRFNEEPLESKKPYYTRDTGRRVRFSSNYDLFQSPAASWRDTLFLEMSSPAGPLPEEVPPACRDVVFDYSRHVRRLGGALFGLLSEAMGLHGGYLEHDAGCMDGLCVLAHYYPPCPEPHLTLGTAKHCDATFITVLLQDAVGGLQALLGGRWVEVVPGALVVNVGDFLQVMSNGKFRSVEHRVVPTDAGARVSVACFFRPAATSTRLYGPIVEDGTPPRYRSFTAAEFLDAAYRGRRVWMAGQH